MMKRTIAAVLALILLTCAPALAQSGTRALLEAIDTLAQHGWILNCAYRVRTDIIDDMKDEYGRPDTDTYVKSAKGTYAEYGDLGVVAGYNHGGTIFELRSFDARLHRITIDDITDYFGSADHTTTSSKEMYVSVVLNEDINIKFVFDKNGDALKHYNVI